MRFIARVNGAPEFNHSFDREAITTLQLETKQTASFVDIFTHMNTIRNLVIVSVNFGAVLFSVYFTLFYTKYLRGNIFENTLMLGTAATTSSLIMPYLMRKYELSTLLMCFHGLNGAIAMAILVFYEEMDWIPILVFFIAVA